MMMMTSPNLTMIMLPLLRLSLFILVSEAATVPIMSSVSSSNNNNKMSWIRKDHTQHRRQLADDSDDDSMYPIQYELWPAEKFQTKLQEWSTRYPEFLKISTSQEKYGLPAAGDDGDCPFYNQKGCPNWIAEVQDYTSFPIGSEASKNLPEVFLSGCLHGNERVGPTSVAEALGLLLESAKCESLPNHSADDGKSHDEHHHDAIQCRKSLEQKGIDTAHRKWLARLVATRRIIVVPTANALGYYRNRREEGSIDPNRDFPYDLEDSTKCMQTIAGRTLNEIYREHMFQLALTFHAGMEVVGYEWGAPTWLNHFSPDDEGQSDVASAYSRYGGGWSHSKPYNYGTMNDLVYYVRGGMEDWAYAGSWDTERVLPCTPNTFNGYPKEKTQYDNSTLRVFNMLIETSDRKEPKKTELGTSKDVLSRDTSENGHVSRNIRLALLAIELVEPYAAIVGVNQLPLSDDIVPGSVAPHTPGDRSSCQSNKAVMIAENAKQVDIQWTVGGAITIQNTELWYGKWDDIPTEQFDCWDQRHPSPEILEKYFTKGTIKGQADGTGYFSRAGAHPRPTSSSSGGSNDENGIDDAVTKETNGPIFVGTIDIPNGLQTLDELVVIASARVDQGWTDQRDNTKPNLPPQSHVVNARTNPDWHFEKPDGKVVHGRLDWFSVPLTIVIGDFTDNVGTAQGGQLVDVVELHPRMGDKNSAGIKGGMAPKSAAGTGDVPVEMVGYLAMVILVVVICLGCCCCWIGKRRRNRSARPVLYGGSNSDDFVFDSKPYSDGSKKNACGAGGGFGSNGYTDDDGSYDSEEDETAEVELPSIA